MSEGIFRLGVMVLLTVFVGAFIFYANRFVDISATQAENGRYVQYDHQQDRVIFGGTMDKFGPTVLDTRTGKKGPAK